MMVLEPKYAVWRQVVQNNGLAVYQKPAGENWDVWAGHLDVVYKSYVESADLADYDATFKPSAATVSAGDDAISQIIGLSTARPDPRTSDGKRIYLSNIFPGDVNVAHPGAADDLAGTRWGGSPLRMEVSDAAPGDSTPYDWQFKDWVYIAGGYLLYSGAVFGDELTYSLIAPATVAAAGTSYSKQALGGGIERYVPGGGGFDLDLDAATPVPSVDAAGNGQGYFNWDADTNVVSEKADGTGAFDLFTVEIPLGQFVPRAQLFGGTDQSPIRLPFTVPAVKAKRLLPQWVHRIVFHNSGDKSAAPFRVVWGLFMGRKETT